MPHNVLKIDHNALNQLQTSNSFGRALLEFLGAFDDNSKPIWTRMNNNCQELRPQYDGFDCIQKEHFGNLIGHLSCMTIARIKAGTVSTATKFVLHPEEWLEILIQLAKIKHDGTLDYENCQESLLPQDRERNFRPHLTFAG